MTVYPTEQEEWSWRERDLLSEISRLRAALKSIAASSCCASCQEAKLVAQKALLAEEAATRPAKLEKHEDDQSRVDGERLSERTGSTASKGKGL